MCQDRAKKEEIICKNVYVLDLILPEKLYCAYALYDCASV